MTCLVVHAGARATGWLAAQRQFVAARTDLAAAGVQIEPDDAIGAWHRPARAMQVAGNGLEVALGRLVDQTRAAGRDTLLLSSPLFLSALANSAWTDRLARVAAMLGIERTIVTVIVREQIGALNQIYCERVLALETAAPFSVFVGEARVRRSVDHGVLLGPALAAPELDVAAVPWSELHEAAGAAQAVLDAAGIAVPAAVQSDAAPEKAQSPGRERQPGPVHVTASRLLVKRLTSRGGAAALDAQALAAAAARVRRRAEHQDWDGDAKYWGWTTALAAEAVERYAASNDAFARTVWGSDWTEPAPAMPTNDLPLLDAEPSTIADVVDLVDRLIAQIDQTASKGDGPPPTRLSTGLRSPGGRPHPEDQLRPPPAGDD